MVFGLRVCVSLEGFSLLLIKFFEAKSVSSEKVRLFKLLENIRVVLVFFFFRLENIRVVSVSFFRFLWEWWSGKFSVDGNIYVAVHGASNETIRVQNIALYNMLRIKTFNGLRTESLCLTRGVFSSLLKFLRPRSVSSKKFRLLSCWKI